jgi:hypothetical protein
MKNYILGLKFLIPVVMSSVIQILVADLHRITHSCVPEDKTFEEILLTLKKKNSSTGAT